MFLKWRFPAVRNILDNIAHIIDTIFLPFLMRIPQNRMYHNCHVCKAKPIAVIQTASKTECEVGFFMDLNYEQKKNKFQLIVLGKK